MNRLPRGRLADHTSFTSSRDGIAPWAAGAAAVFLALVAGIAASTWEAVRANRAGAATRVERDRAVAAQRATAASETRAVEDRNRAIKEKQRADEESATANAINDFLQNDLLRQASLVEQGPDAKPDPDIKVRTALDRAAGRISVRFRNKPLVGASIRHAIGTTYLNLGLLTEAEVQIKQSPGFKASGIRGAITSIPQSARITLRSFIFRRVRQPRPNPY